MVERGVVSDVLLRVSEGVRRGELWAVRCDDVAQWIASRPDDFTDAPQMDRTSWMAAS